MPKENFKRVFVLVMDSLGVGEMPDASDFGDVGANTLLHISENMPNGIYAPNLEKLGLGQLGNFKGIKPIPSHPQSYVMKLKEASLAKDTMTGHWEMMGLHTTVAQVSFTDTGFPDALIQELEKQTGHKIIGNYAASGTEILKELGEKQMKENSLIVYTSADSVLQIAAHEEVTGLQELYRCSAIARELCMRPEWRVGRVIARPFIGTNAGNFKRTSNRHDYALSPTGRTVMDVLKDQQLMTSCIGKIGDIFNQVGVVKTQPTKSNEDGMDKTISEAINGDYQGLVFINLVEFDSEYGHRRNPVGYGEAIERFDIRLGALLKELKDDDLLLITADHGNDPVFAGTDHTREKVFLVAYSPSFLKGKLLPERNAFADIGATVLANFELEKEPHMIGEPIVELLND
ncbi:MAG: phosphopentomutase [Bacilli bacterium]|jgi:phosphopentomutase|nr:phosphopentomutase [Bacilli bacterium]MDD3388841.1 phosphopentomutase [Bacilli bacterium]MDD4345008.1 phosphopentomutase [Bacilli bacterium]MDD4520521.1 phosphopentomutase [Bacilli bacterium]MDY0399209.1 phosphopentomutase [Bacilli bacterium]